MVFVYLNSSIDWLGVREPIVQREYSQAGPEAVGSLFVGYRSPETASRAPGKAERLDRRTTLSLIVAGLIWGLYSLGPATIFSFGPTLLVERGLSIPYFAIL